MLKLSLSLLLVALICALTLALIYKQTAPVIEKQKEILFNRSCKEVLVADTYVQQEDYPAWYEATDDQGKVRGGCLKVSTKGYGGKIQLLAGVDNQGKITGIKILEHNETPGLGSQMQEPKFLDQFKGKTFQDIILVKQKTDKNIQAITGATISSKAVTDVIAQEVEALLKYRN